MGKENTNMENGSTKEESIIYNMLGSATSGLIGRLPCHPLDTCKAKLQVQQSTMNEGGIKALQSISTLDPNINSKFITKVRNNMGFIGKIIGGNGLPLNNENIYLRNTFHALKVTLKREGIYGLYRGGLVTFVGSCPGLFLFFTSFEYYRKYINKNIIKENNIKYSTEISDFFAGFLAEIISCILWVPIDIIKERMQVQSFVDNKYRYTGVSNAVTTMFYNEGITGIFRAYGATILSFGPFSALYLSLHELFKRIITKNSNDINDNKDINIMYIGISACISSGIAAYITNPLDIVKVRMQVQRSGAFNFGYKHIFHGIYTLVKYEGFMSLFHGSGARVAFQVPSVAVNLILYESCTRFYTNNFKF